MYNTALIDRFPAVQRDRYTDILALKSMHALRLPNSGFDQSWLASKDTHSDIFANRFEREADPAFGVTLITSHLCNMRCVYCFSEVGHSKATLNAEAMKRVVSETITKRSEGQSEFSVNFFGGEPTLYIDEIRQVIAHAEKECEAVGISLRLHMVTNGTAPAPVMEYLIDKGVNFVISMDASPERQAPQRLYLKGHDVSQTLRTIELLVARNAPFRVRSTVTGEAVHYMSETVLFFSELGVPWVHFEPVGPSGSDVPGKLSRYSQPAPDVYAQSFIAALDAARDCATPIFGYAFQHLFSSGSSYCAPLSGIESYVVLNANGEVIMCPEIQDPARNRRFGHTVGAMDGEMELRIDQEHKETIAGEARAAQQSSECLTCHARDICKSGCPSRNIQATGALRLLDPYSCKIAKDISAAVIERIARATFGEEVADVPLLRPLRIPREIAAPPIISAGSRILARSMAYWSLTGDDRAIAARDALRKLAAAA